MEMDTEWEKSNMVSFSFSHLSIEFKIKLSFQKDLVCSILEQFLEAEIFIALLTYATF